MDDGINGLRFYDHIHSKRSTIIALLMEYAVFRLNPIYLRINLCIIFKKLTCNVVETASWALHEQVI